MALCLAALASVSGEGASPSYLLRNAWLDGTRMSVLSDPYRQGFRAYTLKSIHLGSPLQGTAEGMDFTLHLLEGTWSWQAGDPPPDMGCMSTPNFCSGPGTWSHPSPGPIPGGSPPPPVIAVRPLNRQLKLSGKIYGADGILPVGDFQPDTVDLGIDLFRSATGDTAVFSEAHTALAGNPVIVAKGRFTLYLGSSAPGQDLEGVLSAQENLFVEFRIGEDILRPRIPVTGGMLAGAPTILSGASDPTAVEPPGTYYRNTAAGSTWIRMTTSWVRIAQ